MKAFPQQGLLDGQVGMDLRDYFAASVMQGLMASQWQVEEPYAIYCYKIADAMIEARSK